MIISVDLHYRTNALDEHRHLGAVAVELDGARLEPYCDVVWYIGEDEMHGKITSIRQRSDHLPHVYVDAVHAESGCAS